MSQRYRKEVSVVRGRPKTPAELMETSGPNRNRNYTKAEVEQKREAERKIKGNSEKVTDVPDYLSELGKEYYSFIVNEMEVSGILSNLDIPIVVQMAETLAILRDCDEAIKNHGTFYMEDTKEGSKLKPNPAVAVRNNTMNNFKQLATQLGMSPASRSSLANMNLEKEKEDGDKLLQILKKKNG